MEINTVMYFWVSQKMVGNFMAVSFTVAVCTALSIMPNNRTSMDLCIHHIFSKELQKQVINLLQVQIADFETSSVDKD